MKIAPRQSGDATARAPIVVCPIKAARFSEVDVLNNFFKTMKMVFSLIASLMGLVACESSSPFHKKNGEWHFESHTLGVSITTPLTPLNDHFARVGDRIFYREDGVEGADSVTFVALDDRYGKDKQAVYFGDTYRDGKEYFLVKRVRVGPIVGADPASFRLLKDGYAADTLHAYYLGAPFAVRDVASFEVLEYGFTRDRMRGYNRLTEIAGSDGASFVALDLDYAKDATHAWYSYLDNDPKTGRMRSVSLDIKGVDAASFVTRTSGYAIDAKRIYYRGRAISASPDGFECLTPSYAKNTSEVLYYGKPIGGAEAATFHVLQPAHEGADAADAKSRYLNGERL